MFAQDIANEMNIKVILNGLYGSNGCRSVFIVMDFDPQFNKDNSEQPLQALSNNIVMKQVMKDYGYEVFPN